VHFYWLIEQIIPQIAITVDQNLQKELELLINQTPWIPYDPDRESIWSEINAKLTQLGSNRFDHNKVQHNGFTE
jgi:hypothetical protein